MKRSLWFTYDSKNFAKKKLSLPTVLEHAACSFEVYRDNHYTPRDQGKHNCTCVVYLVRAVFRCAQIHYVLVVKHKIVCAVIAVCDSKRHSFL